MSRWPLVDVIVIDTMAAVSPGGNENSAEDVGRLLQHCKFLHKKTGALIVLIAHSGKDQSRGIRGWSGTRAAADAEIEVTRNGDYRSATITKLKDSIDSESFSFKLKVVELGFNTEGEAESSCVIEHVENTPEAAPTRQKPQGPHQVVVYDMLKIMAPSGTMSVEDLMAAHKSKMPAGGRKRDGERALEALCAKKLAFMQGEDRVSLSSLVTSGDEGWLSS